MNQKYNKKETKNTSLWNTNIYIPFLLGNINRINEHSSWCLKQYKKSLY